MLGNDFLSLKIMSFLHILQNLDGIVSVYFQLYFYLVPVVGDL